MTVILQVAALTALFFLAQHVFRRAGKWVIWTMFLVAPLLLLPYWIRVSGFGLFLWVKTFSVCGVLVWGTVLRFTSLGDRPWARRSIPLLLAANILEAVAVDACGTGPAHLLNAAAGLLLVALLPYGEGAARVAYESPFRDVYCGTSRGWVAAYTIWNAAFLLLNFPALAGLHAAVLAVAALVAVADPRRWGQTRTFTLGVALMLTATFPDSTATRPDTSAWGEPRLQAAAALLSLAFAAGYAVWAGAPRRRHAIAS